MENKYDMEKIKLRANSMHFFVFDAFISHDFWYIITVRAILAFRADVSNFSIIFGYSACVKYTKHVAIISMIIVEVSHDNFKWIVFIIVKASSLCVLQ